MKRCVVALITYLGLHISDYISRITYLGYGLGPMGNSLFIVEGDKVLFIVNLKSRDAEKILKCGVKKVCGLLCSELKKKIVISPLGRKARFFSTRIKIELRISKIFNRDEVEVKYLKFLTRFDPSGKGRFSPCGEHYFFYWQSGKKNFYVVVRFFFRFFILERATHQNPAGPPPYLPGGTIRIPYRHGRAIRILIATVEKTLPFSSMRDIGKPLFYHGSKK